MENKIAVVGMGALFPDAKNTDEFWQNIITQKVSIRPLSEDLFESEVFYRPELLTAFNKEDKSVTRIAGWIDDLHFDTVRKYKIPPSVAEHMDSNQHAALYTTGQALEMNPLKGVPNDRVAVIFGNGMVGTRYGDAMFRVQFQLMEHYLRKHAGFQKLSTSEQKEIVEYVRVNVLKGTIPISEDSAPGVLPNIIAGRIASVFDFHGPSFTVDAACASVLAAVITGVQGLQIKEYDAVICGGSDMPLKQLGFVLFSALNALSPDGSYPFDQRANGFVMGQGAGTVVLKRLEDAIRDQDTIYAVITGYGEASDGKGKYIAAPNQEWQRRTIEKACRMAGYPIDTIEMVEAHGTATKVGDVVEVAALKQAFESLGVTRKNYCGLTSIKSNIGHLKSAAGIAGLIKAVLAIHNHKLPPTAGFETVNPKLELDDSPFYILDELREWDRKKDYPRRANVSSFGFGGADYHLALEEYRPADNRQPVYNGFSAEKPTSIQVSPTDSTANPPQSQPIFFSAQTIHAVDRQVLNFLADYEKQPEFSFADFCSLHNYNVRADAEDRLAILAASSEDLRAKFEIFTQNRVRLASQAQPHNDFLRTKGIYFKQGRATTPAETTILFPGQASQYLNMFRLLFERYDTVRTWYRRADAYWYARRDITVSSLIFPTGENEDEALERLRQTQHAHPSIFISSFALYDLLSQMGLTAQSMVGHSLGEITALAAAGKVPFEDALKLVEQRGYAFSQENLEDPGKMLSLASTVQEARQLIEESGIAVLVANINSPHQVILAGSSADIDLFKQFLDRKKVTNKLLFVSHAFHTRRLEPVADRFYQGIQDIAFRSSKIRVAMNHTGSYYPDEPESLLRIPQLLRDQILQPVDFVGSIEKLYQDGVRLFVEVGPGSILSGLVREILGDREAVILTSNFKGADDLVSLQKLWAALFAEGVPIKLLAERDPAQSQIRTPIQMQAAAQPEKVQLVQERSPSRVYPGPGTEKVTVVYSGVSVGLPGSYKETFRDDNFEQLFQGRNLIERLTDDEKQRLVDLQITKLIKDESGPTFKLLTSLDDVIQLAGKIGRIDMIRDYHIDEKIVQNMSSCIANGVAAGYEALKDAQIPLVREYMQTTTGKWLPQKLALPKPMQDETGVIFANGFPLIDPVIQEISRYISYAYGSKTRKELISFYESLIGRVKDYDAKKLLTDWFTLYYSRLSEAPGPEEVYRFNHHFMTQISAQANNLLASLLNAKGPNFQLNAACSSTSNAITIAEDFIRTGRVKRMIVVGADDPTSPTNFPLLGAGFLCTGAATNEGDLYKAAVPFDRRRNGMLVGAGAVGIILEAREEVEKRGVIEICELLGTHSFNTAKHISQIDIETFASELDKFISRMEQEYGLQRKQMAGQTVYISHETYTPPRGGCSQTEAEALKRAFGDDFQKIIVGNTKGMTGHTMGASIEDAVAAKSLQYGKCPPVVNYAEPDPLLDCLNLWDGGSHDRTLALKMSAGFGSQGHFALLRKVCSGENRIANRSKYGEWLRSIASDDQAGTEQWGRVLVIKENGATPVEKASRPFAPNWTEPDTHLEVEEVPATVEIKRDYEKKDLETSIIELISRVTSYPPEMLEPEMEFEADLGIDEQKRLAILSQLVEQFELRGMPFILSGDMTIGQLIKQVASLLETAEKPESSPSRSLPPAQGGQANSVKDAIIAETIKLFAEVTKYPEDALELDMEMESDLGIDTVKQAMILAMLGEKYGLERQEGIQLSNYPTIRRIVDLVYEKGQLVERAPVEPIAVEKKKKPGPETRPEITHPVWHTSLSRQVPVLVAEPPGPKTFDVQGKTVWLLGDNQPVIRAITSALQNKQVQVDSFIFPQTTSTKEVEKAIAAFAAGKEVDVIIDCTHIGVSGVVPFDQLPGPEQRKLLFMSSEARFAAYKSLSRQIKHPAKIVCVTAIDGYLGLEAASAQVNDPSFGALTGFYKGLRKEWTDSELRIVDFAPQAVAESLEECVNSLVAELENAGPGVEIGYRNGRRMVVKLDDKEIQADQKLGFSEKDTFLITGGGTGVAARILLAMAQSYPANFVVVDQVALPENIEALVALDEAGLEQLKKDLHEQLRRKNQKVTPVLLNREFEKITRAIEAYRNLEEVRRCQRKVVYIPSDVRDFETLKHSLEQARQTLGPITGILHAAGIDQSHLIDQKSAEEFHNVFSVKAHGACNLMELCKNDPLKWVVAFSSISGRFGNAAQLDYCAANNFLSDWIKLMRQTHPGVHALCLDWSGWKEVGIAWRNELVREKSEEMGLNFIEVDEGIAAFMQEIENRTGDSEVVIHRGLDGFLEKGLTTVYLPDYPLIDRITKKDHKIERAYRLFSVHRDGLIDQHRLGKVPILPAVAYAELAVEYYALQAGKKRHYLLRDMTFPFGFKLFHEQPRELFVEGNQISGEKSWSIEIKSRFKPPKTEEAQTILHSRAIVSDELTDTSDLNPEKWTYHQEEPTSLPAEESLMLIKNQGPEQRIILGPLFNDVLRESKSKEPVLIYPKGTTYPSYFPWEQLTSEKYPMQKMFVNPCFLDSLYQACAANLLVTRKCVFLPWEIGELGIVHVPRQEGLYTTYVQVVEDSEEVVGFNVVMVDRGGKICYFARRLRFHQINL